MKTTWCIDRKKIISLNVYMIHVSALLLERTSIGFSFVFPWREKKIM